tara:strand:- start:4231 stop:4854 length:624 start_codon:yes stop_codon:yes gene_type:complete
MNDFLKFMKKEITEKDVIETYKNLKKKIDEYGFTVSGTVDGEGALERPFAHTFGFSFISGFEIICFFPIKDKGLSIVGGFLNKIVEKVKLNEMSITDQIIDQESIYYLPLAMHVFDDETQKDVERVWAKQLERDGAFSELSTDNHKLALIIATDKNGNFPWDEDCESYWPEMCPPPLAAMAQMAILGEDTLLTKLESAYKKINTDNS